MSKDSVFNEPTKMLLQKNKEYKKTLFESGNQSFIIAMKRFVQVKSFTTATENWPNNFQTGTFKTQPRFFFFPLSEI